MSQQPQYQNPITRAVVRLVELAVKGEPDPAGAVPVEKKKKNVLLSVAWHMIEPQLPMMLYSLDHNPDALAAIQAEILQVSQENLTGTKGSGYLAWVNPDCPDENKRVEKLCPS